MNEVEEKLFGFVCMHCRQYSCYWVILYPLIANIRLFVGSWSLRVIEVPIYLSWPWISSITCCSCWRFGAWIWLYSCGLWLWWAYRFNHAVRNRKLSLSSPWFPLNVASSTVSLTGFSFYFPLIFCCRCVLDPGDKIVDCPPTFTMYEFDAGVNAAEVIKGRNMLSTSFTFLGIFSLNFLMIFFASGTWIVCLVITS